MIFHYSHKKVLKFLKDICNYLFFRVGKGALATSPRNLNQLHVIPPKIGIQKYFIKLLESLFSWDDMNPFSRQREKVPIGRMRVDIKKLLFISLFLNIFSSQNIFAQPANNLTLHQALQLAENNSSQITANEYENLAADQSINVAKANYYPTLSFEAIDSTGFPGSSNGIGVEGMMGSPYRQGYGYGLVAQQTVWDFGRTSAKVKAAQYQAILNADTTKVTRDQVKQLALQTFYACAFDKTQINTWTILSKDSAMITNQVNHFVNTGQQSIVDGDLSRAQTDEAQTELAFYHSLLNDATNRLSIILGIPSRSISCPTLPADNNYLNIPSSYYASPLLAQAQANSNVAYAKAQEAKANYYPQIVAIASLGELQNVRLVQNNENYSAGIGVIFPIFDIGTHADVSRAELAAEAQDENVSAQEQNLSEINSNYDEVIDSSNTKLQYLNKELNLANQAFSAAQSRYFSFQGDLVDLRDAFTNLARIENEINETRAQLLAARGAKILVNGGKI